MYHIAKDKRAYNSVNKICNAMTECLKTKKITDITVTDLQKRSKIGRATFYRLFDNTTDVLSFLCDKVFIEAGKEFAEINFPTADRTTLCFIEKCMENKTLLTAIVESNRMDLLYNAHKKFFEIGHDFFFPNLTKEDLNYLTTTLTACTCAFIVSWVKNNGAETPKELQKKLKICYKTLGKIFE